MEEKDLKTQRLCSEIQLFDLCSEETCKHKDGRFCTKEDLLAKFEAISEDDPEMYLAEDGEEAEDADNLEDSFDEDDYGADETDEEY